MKRTGKFAPKLKFDPSKFLKHVQHCEDKNWSSANIEDYMIMRQTLPSRQNFDQHQVSDYLNTAHDSNVRLHSAFDGRR